MNELANKPIDLPAVLVDLQPVLLTYGKPVHLVGGAVRDQLLGRSLHDLDLIVPDEAIQLAFRIGDRLGHPAYILDRDRDVGRVVFPDTTTTIDIARYRGPDLISDLQGRDFTVNALAAALTGLEQGEIIDIADGMGDLDSHTLRMVAPYALSDDPLRTLRAVRFTEALGLSMTDDTRAAVVANGPRLAEMSRERVRDELVNLMMLDAPQNGLRQLEELGLLSVILPEVAAMDGIEQSPPHHEPVLDHTLSVLRWLTAVEAALLDISPADTASGILPNIQPLLPYRPQLQAHISQTVDGGYGGRLLLRLSALFHDVGKPETRTVDDDGRIRFFGHDKAGARIAARRLRRLAFSNEAIDHIKYTIDGHMRPLGLANSGQRPSRRAIYRFFQASDSSGIDIGLLSLADHLATHRGPGDPADWDMLVAVVGDLFAGYFDVREEVVSPPSLVSGTELMAALDIPGGPEVGRLLALIQEAQAAGEIQTAEQALALAAAYCQA